MTNISSTSKGKFEAHITLDKSFASRLKEGINGWSYSAIDDDPIMGQKPYCYLTAYNVDVDVLREAMDLTLAVLYEMSIPTLRIKIERIVFDSKTGVDELGPTLNVTF